MVTTQFNIGRESRFKLEEEIRTIDITASRQLRQPSPVEKATDMCRQDILFAVTPERGWGSIHLMSLARISIAIRLNQVGSCHEWWGLWRTRRARISPHTIKMLDLGKPYNVHPPKAALTTVSEERGAWCRQVHRRTRSTKNCTPALG